MMVAQPGVATISVDLTSAAGRRKGEGREEATIKRLVELFDVYEIPAAWAAPEPARSPAMERITTAAMAHEIAILGDASWVGAAAGRRSFAIELAHRTAAARAAGLTIHALAAPHAQVPREHYDLLVKHGVGVVRQPRVGAGRALSDLQPQSLRHGVWETPAAAMLPCRGAWWGKGAGAARAVVRRAIASSHTAHLVLDAGRLASADPRLQAVENVLRCISRYCGRGVLRAAALTTLAQEWARPAPSLPARSILRAA